ncbi:hypothetical protein [Kangiella sp. M94]
MIEIGLIAALFFILIAVIASYLLKAVVRKRGNPESSIDTAKTLAVGMPPITSLKAKYIQPGSDLPQLEQLGAAGKWHLMLTRTALLLAVLSVLVGVIFELVN